MKEENRHAERTGIKHKEFTTPLHQWTLDNLPSSSSFWITDIDMVIRDRQGNLMLVEVKCQGKKCETSQNVTFQILDHALKNIDGLKVPVSIGGNTFQNSINYHGFHNLTFTASGFNDGEILWDNKPIEEKELIKVLSFSHQSNSVEPYNQ